MYPLAIDVTFILESTITNQQSFTHRYVFLHIRKAYSRCGAKDDDSVYIINNDLFCFMGI
jgi:hypothetical protein